jgi:hypothetical protein
MRRTNRIAVDVASSLLVPHVIGGLGLVAWNAEALLVQVVVFRAPFRQGDDVVYLFCWSELPAL